MERREISSRSNGLIQKAARALADTKVTPNQISCFSVVAAVLVPFGLFVLPALWGSVLALLGIQLRLLANVIDGLVAVEGGKSSPLGSLYNEFPDRIADSMIFIALGYACERPDLGWASALLAALTAYVRTFGGALGLPQSFRGPMAKQHRMAVVSAALAAMAVVASGAWPSALPCMPVILESALWVVAAGSAITCMARTRDIARALQQAPK